MQLSGVIPPRPVSISLTPLIDVVFILLLFFMLTSSFIQWRAVDLPLSTESHNQTGSEGSSLAPDIIVVRADGEIEFRRRRLSVDQLAGLDQNAVFVLKAEPESSLQQIMRVLDQLTSQGITQVSLAHITHELSP